MILYKVLNKDGSARMGTGKWLLPSHGHPGKWMPQIEGIVAPCQNGYHLCRPDDLIEWLGPATYVAETRGEMVKSDNKIIVREARLIRRLQWSERMARLFAADCAEHVLSVFEKRYPTDARPRKCIRVARRYAKGKATQQELAAARDAARAAAWAAAVAAAWTAGAAGAAWTAVAAAWAAAGDAVGAAVERKWQTRRLFEYLSRKRG